MILFLFFPVIFGLIGILLLSAHFKITKKNEKCTSQVTGRIIRLNANTSRRTNSTARVTYYYPVFQYVVNGSEYTLISTTGSSNPRRFSLDSAVIVHYDPSSPDTAYVKETKVALIVGITFLSCAIIFVVLLFFLCHMSGFLF